MFKFTTACAIIAAAASATEWSAQPQQLYSYPQGAALQNQLSYYTQAPLQQQLLTYYQEPRYTAQPQGFAWTRRSTIRPGFVEATMPELIDSYWSTAPKATETLIASCEFDFFGYSFSTARVTLTQEEGDNVTMEGFFEGIEPGRHGFKIHEYGDLSNGCESTGEVFNPYDAPWGSMTNDITERRVGDIQQVQGRFDRKAEYNNRDTLVMLSGPNSVVGRAMVFYAGEDDFDVVEHEATATRPAIEKEGMGERLGCCVIGLVQGEKPKAPKW